MPVLGSFIFLLYYRFAGWSEWMQISGYMEVVGVALPFMISVVCAGNIELEEQNHFQVLLGGYANKWESFWLKWLVLAAMGFLAILAAVACFGAGYHLWLGREGLPAGMYMQLILVLFFGSMPLYLEHLFWNLMLPKTVSLCVGVAECILSALFLTGLGDARWQFFPCTWSARGVLLWMNGLVQGKTAVDLVLEWRVSIRFCLLLFIVICVIIGVWYHFYEGRHCND